MQGTRTRTGRDWITSCGTSQKIGRLSDTWMSFTSFVFTKVTTQNATFSCYVGGFKKNTLGPVLYLKVLCIRCFNLTVLMSCWSLQDFTSAVFPVPSLPKDFIILEKSCPAHVSANSLLHTIYWSNFKKRDPSVSKYWNYLLEGSFWVLLPCPRPPSCVEMRFSADVLPFGGLEQFLPAIHRNFTTMFEAHISEPNPDVLLQYHTRIFGSVCSFYKHHHHFYVYICHFVRCGLLWIICWDYRLKLAVTAKFPQLLQMIVFARCPW